MDEAHLEPIVKLLIVVLVLLFNVVYYVLTLLKRRKRRREGESLEGREPAPRKRSPLEAFEELLGRVGGPGQGSPLEQEDQELTFEADSWELPGIEEEPVVSPMAAVAPHGRKTPGAPRALPPAPPPSSPEEGPSPWQEDIVEAILLGAILRRRDPAAARR